MTGPSVLIRVDGGGRIGHGHLCRMQALALELRIRGARVDFITRTPGITRLLGEEVIPDRGPEATQGPRLLELAAEYDVLVIDLPELPDSDPPEYQAIRIIPRSHPWPGLPAPAGWEHVILRREFRRERRCSPPTDLLYVSGGGSDASGLGETLRRAARRVQDAIMSSSGECPAAAVVTAMDLSSLALITYGMTALECAARGLPSVCICPTEYHAEGARQLEAAGACVSLGLERDPGRIARTALGLLSRPEQLRTMSEIGPRLIDGRGAERVAGHVLSLVRGEG